MEERSWEEYVSTYLQVDEKEKDCLWTKGDIAIQVRTAYGEGSLKKFASEVGCSTSYVSRLRQTSETFESVQRCNYLSWMHHYICSKTDDPHDWLAKAHDNNWSTRDLQEAIKAATEPPKTEFQLLVEKGEAALKKLDKFLLEVSEHEWEKDELQYFSGLSLIMIEHIAYARDSDFENALDPESVEALVILDRIQRQQKAAS